MLLRLCQLKSLMLLPLLLGGCTFWKSAENYNPQELVTMLNTDWFGDTKEHLLADTDGKVVSHLFFDIEPRFNGKARMVNIVLTTPQQSKHRYHMDMASGQRHYGHTYCKQKDIWQQEPGVTYRPEYSLGHIPRFLDQIGEPQKVVLFSNPKKRFTNLDGHFYRVRLVGAYVEQICPQGNCVGKNNWLSRMVFVAVEPDDTVFNRVKSSEDLKLLINWKEIKASLENIDGRNSIGDTSYPSTKVGQLLSYEEAFSFFQKKSIFFADGELEKIIKGCYSLYDSFWKEVGLVQPEDLPADNSEALNLKLKHISALKKEKRPIGFAQRLAAFTRKYFDEFNTCGKVVYPGNVNYAPEKFWFLSFMKIYYQLHKDGYYFDCKMRSWQKNVLNVAGNPVHNLRRDIAQCDEADIDFAMGYMPNFLMSLKNSGTHYYRFIDYDNHSFGTHRKLYSWVKVPRRKFDCSSETNEAIIERLQVFPEDVKWQERAFKDVQDRMKIIE